MDVILTQLKEWENLAGEAHYRAETLAKLCQLSTRQLQRRFRIRVGKSPQAWLDDRRIAAAGQMLLSGKPVKAVAYDLGFKQVSHFCRMFKLRNKMTPLQFVVVTRESIGNVAVG